MYAALSVRVYAPLSYLLLRVGYEAFQLLVYAAFSY